MKRNITLDYFKLFLSLLVIIIHMPVLFPGMELFEWFIRGGVARVAVPCFFIINGYFIGKQISDGKFVKKYIARLLAMYITWSLIYFALFYRMPPRIIILFLTTGYWHLWYIMALMVGVILLYFIKRQIKNHRLLLIMAVVLVVLGYCVQEFYLPRSFYVREVIARNGVFMGLPFVYLGYYIKSMQDKMTRIKTSYLLLALLCGLACLFFDSGKFFNNLYISLIVICPALFILVLKHSKYSDSDGYISKLSTGVYFVHPLVILFVYSVLNNEDLNNKRLVLLPVVFFLSMVLSTGIIALNKRIRIFL